MTDEEQNLLIALAAFYVWQRYTIDVVPALQQGGARAYDVLHDDAGHQQDLPRPERMEQHPPIVTKRLAAMVTLCKEVGFPNPELAAAIAMAESGGKHDEIADTPREYSVGLFQINIKAHPGFSKEYLLDPVKNARAALQISKQGADWRPWSAYKNGTYKRFLP